ncbi:type II toxin-antitoxin system ParD family antitoxin [Rhizobium leguminosarum bv. viciae]|nr:type II toxin-antitoxin system ParD family antitoxin [Rhizobium leguminosarum bv. viciae]
MAKVVSIRIDDHMEEDAGLRLPPRKAELAAIEVAIIDGEKSGKPRPFDFDAFIEGKRARRGRQ